MYYTLHTYMQNIPENIAADVCFGCDVLENSLGIQSTANYLYTCTTLFILTCKIFLRTSLQMSVLDVMSWKTLLVFRVLPTICILQASNSSKVSGKAHLPTLSVLEDQRTIGPENAHLKPDLGVLSHYEMTLTLNTHTPLLTSQVVCICKVSGLRLQ